MVNYAFGDPEAVNPFLWGEFGFMAHSFKSDLLPLTEGRDTAAVVAGGAGVDFPLGGVNGFVAAGYTKGLGDNSDTTYIGIYAGLSFPLVGGM